MRDLQQTSKSLASLLLAIGGAAMVATPTLAQESPATHAAADGGNELAELSLDQLMNVEVTSVAGVRQSYFATPAAAYVLRAEDIAAAGHLTLAESLRVVPGIHVARTSSNEWGISTRGFNSRLANKQLVQIDGRVVYNPFFAGVLWDIQQPMLADIAQVEVIRGPGTTLWGTNAVNGVISVTTLSARDTQGGVLVATGGIGDVQSKLDLRYGGKLATDAYYRVYGQFIELDNQEFADGRSAEDNWDLLKGGLRLDFGRPGDVTLTLLGEVYGTERIGSQRLQNPFLPQTPGMANPVENAAKGGHLTAKLARETDASGWQLQLIVDRFDREDSHVHENATVYDVDWRQHFRPDARNEVVYGFGSRTFIYDSSHEPDADYFFDPAGGTKTTASAFIQDTYAIVPEHVFAMVGTKFEHNDYTGFEVQPSARLWWTPNDRHTVWTSVARSVRVPAITDIDTKLRVPIAGAPPFDSNTGDADSEVAWTYEVGYRTRVIRDVTLDIATYYSRYTSLLGAVPASASGIFPPENDGSGQTYGVETNVQWQATDDVAVTVGYTFAREELDDSLTYGSAPSTPQNMVHLGVDWRLTRDVRLDAHGYYVDAWDDGVGTVDSYIRMDLGLRWQLRENCEFAIWGQNLLDSRHPESSRGALDGYGETTEIGRSAYAQITFKF